MNKTEKNKREYQKEIEITQKNYTINKTLRFSGISYIVLFILFVIPKGFLPQGDGWWSEFPIIDYLVPLGLSISFFGISATYAYYSWLYNKKEYPAWYRRQMTGEKQPAWLASYQKWRIGKEYTSYQLWSIRIITSFISLIAIVLIGASIVDIIKFFL